MVMSDAVVVALIAASASLAASAVTLIAILHTKAQVTKDVREVHLSLNSRVDELVKAAESVGFVAGVKSEVDKAQAQAQAQAQAKPLDG